MHRDYSGVAEGFGLKVQAVEFRIQGLLSRKLGPMHLRVGILLADERLRGPKRWDEGRWVKGSSVYIYIYSFRGLDLGA